MAGAGAMGSDEKRTWWGLWKEYWGYGNVVVVGWFGSVGRGRLTPGKTGGWFGSGRVVRSEKENHRIADYGRGESRKSRSAIGDFRPFAKLHSDY